MYLRAAPLLLVLLAFDAHAFSCSEMDPAEKIIAAERVILIHVLETRLETPEQFEIALEPDEADHARMISVGYEVLEELKGDPNDTPRLLEVLAFAAGYPDLTPGVTYLIAYDRDQFEEEDLKKLSGFMLVTACEVMAAYMGNDIDEDSASAIALARRLRNQ